MAPARSALLIYVAVPLAWVAVATIRRVARSHGDLIAAAAGRPGVRLGDVQADVRWWLKHLDGAGQ